MRKPQVVILLAGIGSRLGMPHPKSLTPLGNGETILSRQLRILHSFDLKVSGVVGFKKDLIMEAAPEMTFSYNPDFDRTNTSKSLLTGLRHFEAQSVLWLNGDVVFNEGVIEAMLATEGSVVAVNNARVAEEEVKYNLDPDGFIKDISKSVDDPLGEAVGVNLVDSEDLEAFKQHLDEVDDQDYFERAIELMIQRGGGRFRPMPIAEGDCIEVDFDQDLDRARELVRDD